MNLNQIAKDALKKAAQSCVESRDEWLIGKAVEGKFEAEVRPEDRTDEEKAAFDRFGEVLHVVTDDGINFSIDLDGWIYYNWS